jgi:N-acetylneuraminate synthase
MKIAERQIAAGGATFIIAEVAQAHDGSLGYAHAFIDAAAKAGADAIKFQTHIASAESTLDEAFRVPMSGQDATRYDYWRRMEFTPDQWRGLAAHAAEKRLIFLSSAFSVEAVELLAGLGMPAWKVGSGEAFNTTLIDAMLAKGGPILLSSGMSTWQDLSRMVDYVIGKGCEIGLFQCTTRYPTALEHVGLNVLEEMRRRFDVPVGLSDHSGTPWPALAAMSMAADFLELHVTFDRGMYGPDVSSSVTFADLAMLAEANQSLATMRANPVDKDAAASQLAQTKALFTKSVSLVRDLPAGTLLAADMLTLKKPAGGMLPDELPQLVGRRLSRDVTAKRLLRPDDLV